MYRPRHISHPVPRVAWSFSRDGSAVRGIAPSEFPQVIRFYHQTGYNGGLTEHDRVLVAEHGGRILGVLRLCPEAGTLVLRGMRVLSPLQRQGIGSTLLAGAVAYLSEEDCYCLPHRHLKKFYSTIGFMQIDPAAAPKFLRKRWEKYRHMGLDSIIMLRKSGEIP